MSKIGVFLCHCGSNIAGTVDIEKVKEAVSHFSLVSFVSDNHYTCSEVGQNSIQQAIKEKGLERVVIAACSPRMHENTFRKTVAQAGVNPYLLEIANLREQNSWVHSHDKDAATAKAIELVKMAVAKVARNDPLFPRQVSLTKRALVLGGGIAGIQAALDIANTGYEVVLVERQPSIGGRMAQLDKTFPTLDCSACILTPKMVDVGQHPNITLLTYAEIVRVDGFVGNFEVQIRQKPRYVDHQKCIGCGICWQKCPEKVPSEFDMGLGKRTVIYIPFPQAVPNKPVIDWDHCRYYRHLEAQKKGEKAPPCRICERLCPVGAVTWEQTEQILTERFGAIVVATGYQTFDHRRYEEYGGGRYPDVITGLQLERLMSPAGPTDGEIVRPSDGQHPKTVVFINCVGSRDERMGRPYCSKVCCMYTAKQAFLLKEHHPETQCYIFYIDIRAGGKDFEEFARRTQEQAGAVFLRGRVSKIYDMDKKLVVLGEDSLMGRPVEIAADLVVLATGIEPSAGAPELARTLKLSYDQYGFLTEAHPKLRPVESYSEGIFLAGTCIGPKDIPESVAQGSAAAAKALILLSKASLPTEPATAIVDQVKCVGCFACEKVCPYGAIERQVLRDGRLVASVNENLCASCGLCTVACLPGAVNLRGFTSEQLLAEVNSLWR